MTIELIHLLIKTYLIVATGMFLILGITMRQQNPSTLILFSVLWPFMILVGAMATIQVLAQMVINIVKSVRASRDGDE